MFFKFLISLRTTVHLIIRSSRHPLKWIRKHRRASLIARKKSQKNQQFFYKNKCRQKVIPLSLPPSAANMSNTKIMLRYGVISLVFLARLARAWQILVGKVTGKRLEFEQNLRVFDFKNHTNVKNKRLVQMSAVAGVIPARNRSFHQVRWVSTTQ